MSLLTDLNANRILQRVGDELSTVVTCFHRFDTDGDGAIDRNELQVNLYIEK